MRFALAAEATFSLRDPVLVEPSQPVDTLPPPRLPRIEDRPELIPVEAAGVLFPPPKRPRRLPPPPPMRRTSTTMIIERRLDFPDALVVPSEVELSE